MQAKPVELIEYAPRWQAPLIAMWRASFEHGVGIKDFHTVEEQSAYFHAEVLPKNSVRLVLADSLLVGFVAATDASVAQLYVRVGCHRQGIGSRMLEWAKLQSEGSLWLYTFARNHVAQAFYERHGFAVVERGFEPSWQLDDIRYEWHAEKANSPA